VATGILLTGGPYFDPCPDGNTCPYTTLTNTGINILFNNDVGVYLFNTADGVTGPPTPTVNVTYFNLVGADTCYNPYTVGISDLGNFDYVVYNYVMPGGGYDPPCGAHYDTSGSINPVLTPYPGTNSIELSAVKPGMSARPKAVPFGL